MPAGGIGMMMSADEHKLMLIQRTQERFTKFGIANLRTYDVFSLRRVAIAATDVEQSPLLSNAKDSFMNRASLNVIDDEII